MTSVYDFLRDGVVSDGVRLYEQNTSYNLIFNHHNLIVVLDTIISIITTTTSNTCCQYIAKNISVTLLKYADIQY